MENSTYFTIGQAAKETGKAKSTIKKSIDNGELSVAEKTARGFKIEASELFRVFPRKTEERSQNTPIEQTETAEERIENGILKAKLELADQRYDDAQRTIKDLRSDRDAWRQQATGLIEDKSEKNRPDRGLFGRLVKAVRG
jgi:hypothetical protein